MTHVAGHSSSEEQQKALETVSATRMRHTYHHIVRHTVASSFGWELVCETQFLRAAALFSLAVTAVATGTFLETSGGPQLFKAGTLVESPTPPLPSGTDLSQYNRHSTTTRQSSAPGRDGELCS